MSRYWFPGLLCAHVLIVWLLPVLPGQDLPQHLGYARILLEGRSDPLFREFYSLATGMQSYFTSYYLLTGLAHVVPLEAAARVLYTAYVIGMFFAFRALVVAVSGSPASTGLLVSLLVWSAVACMGFLAFLLATPALLAATALFLRIAEDPAGTRWRELALAVCCFVLGSLHVVANACLALFCALYTIFSPTRQRARALLLVLTAVALVSGLWVALGDRPLGTHAPLPTSDAIRSAMGLEFLNEAFQIAWQDPPAKLTYFLWNLLGPYRLGGQLVVAGVLGAVAFAVWKGGARPLPSAPRQRAFRRAVLAFLAAGWLTPWGLWIPSEVTFLDFRLISIGFALLAAAIDPRWFASRLAAGALASACVLLTAHFGARALAFGREAESVLRLLQEAEPPGVMLTLAFHNRSAEFGKQFHLTHFLPMYYTVRQRGINSQFWARYAERFPVEYRPGKPPASPPDWLPWEFNLSHLADADFVLIQRATEENGADDRVGSVRAEGVLRQHAQLVRCDGLWCLYRTARGLHSH